MGDVKKLRKGFAAILAILCVLIVISGKIYYDHKISNMQKESEKMSAKIDASGIEKTVNYYKKNRGTIVYSPVGDSLTHGYYASTESKQFTNVLAHIIEKQMGYKVTVNNNSKYGGTLENGLNAIPQIQQQKPDFLTIEFGTNDSNDENHVPIPTFKSRLNQLIDGIYKNRSPKPKIVLVTTWQYNAPTYDNAIESVGKKRNIPVADISALRKNQSNIGPAGNISFRGTTDNFHPNDIGHAAIADTIFSVAEKELNTIK